MQVNYCSQEQLVYGTAKRRVPRGRLGISLSEYGLAIKEVELRNEFTSGPAVPALHCSGEKEGGGDRGERWDRPLMHCACNHSSCDGAEIRMKSCREANSDENWE